VSDYKRGPLIKVRVDENGTPYCPHCGQLMYGEETDDGTSWGCPDARFVNEFIARELAAALDRYVIRDEP
jgi:acetyl-CoA carboxylase beta subunit